MDKDIVRKLKSAANRWEAENQIIGFGQLRVCDALRDSAYAIEDLETELSAYRALGPIDDLTALAKARDDERFAVLPCKLGDTVWNIKFVFSYYSEPKEEVVDRFSFSDDGVNVICMSGYKFRIERFGKTVFLTRAEAEAALKGENDV